MVKQREFAEVYYLHFDLLVGPVFEEPVLLTVSDHIRRLEVIICSIDLVNIPVSQDQDPFRHLLYPLS